MPTATITPGDLRRALTNALAGASLEHLDDVLHATTVLPADAIAGALLEGGRAARQITERRAGTPGPASPGAGDSGVAVAHAIAAWLRSEAGALAAVQREPGRQPTSPVSARGACDLAAAIEAQWGAGTTASGALEASAAPTLRAELDDLMLKALIAAAERAAATPGHEFTDESLDEDVHDAASAPGTAVNNGGVGAQIRYLADQFGVGHVGLLLRRLGVTPGASAPDPAREPHAGVIAYDRWEHFAGTLTDRARTDPDTVAIDVDRVPADRRAAIVSSWRFGAFDQRTAGADSWWTSVGGPWFDALHKQLVRDGYGLSA